MLMTKPSLYATTFESNTSCCRSFWRIFFLSVNGDPNSYLNDMWVLEKLLNNKSGFGHKFRSDWVCSWQFEVFQGSHAVRRFKIFFRGPFCSPTIIHWSFLWFVRAVLSGPENQQTYPNEPGQLNGRQSWKGCVILCLCKMRRSPMPGPKQTSTPSQPTID